MTVPGSTAAGDRRWAIALTALGAVAAALAWPDLHRAGYSPDEEFTLVAARAIAEGGLPLLPSGLLYDRGLAYSYASWAAGYLGGQSLAAYRIVSLAAGAAALVALWRGLRRFAAAPAAALAVALTAASLPFWVSASTARFYTPFLLSYLIVLVVLEQPRWTWRHRLALVIACAAARWTHELAFTLGGVPLAAALLAPPGSRRLWWRRTALVCGGLLTGQAAIIAVHAAAPPSNGDVMIRRFFVWQVLNLFERPPFDLVRALPAAALFGALAAVGLGIVRRASDPLAALVVVLSGLAGAIGQLAIAPLAALVAVPVCGQRLRGRLVAATLATTVAATVFWIVALSAAGTAPAAAARVVFSAGFAYPLDMLEYLVAQTPMLVIATAGVLLRRATQRGGPWPVEARALHLLWIGWVLWFGVIASGITARYLLLPVTFMLSALALDAWALAVRRDGGVGVPALAAVLAMAVAVSVESWRGPSLGESRAEVQRPTFVPEAIAPEIQRDDLLACTDELACMLTAGRADAWLALDPFFRERFIVIRQGEPTGAYTGAPAEDTLAPLLARAAAGNRRLVVLDVLKDVPAFGPTTALVPRQLARERMRGEVLAAVPGARLVHVVPDPEQSVARLIR